MRLEAEAELGVGGALHVPDKVHVHVLERPCTLRLLHFLGCLWCLLEVAELARFAGKNEMALLPRFV